MKQQNTAFTLVELLVVIAIFATLIAVGITALVNLSNRSQVNTATQDFLSTSKTYIQRARNSVYTNAELDKLKEGWRSTCVLVDEQFPPDAIGFTFDQQEVSYIKCSRNSSLSADFCCVNADTEEIIMRNDEQTFIQPQDDCNGVVFEYATGEVYSFSNEDLLSITASKSNCEVRIRHNSISYFKTVVFNGEKNEVKIAE
ncbi:prepilin-type N-terminal cleavage/methylation domain-containing protein [Candidatus Dojkabacteria bacterium]|nr:prepilin-type N-terminal cleavage/methylation domain-containing protein [Candidatus Dojkabacteria bacterium]